MPNWNEILDEVGKAASVTDITRRKYLKSLSSHTKRNVIIYYSGWLQKGNAPVQVNDADKNGFMTVIHKLDRSKGLDLILHTPGGDAAATESIVDYLKSMFENDIRAIIPQLAMSAGTMIACSAKEIIMGKQSSLGPIDPQIMGVPAHGIIEEFERADEEIRKDHRKVAIWQQILAKYNPTLIGECEKAIEWAEEMVEEWLLDNMLKNDSDSKKTVENIIAELGDHSVNKSHSRHLSAAKCKDIGLKITDLEDDNKLQDLVLSVHHATMHSFSVTNAYKIIENQNGVAYVPSSGKI